MDFKLPSFPQGVSNSALPSLPVIRHTTSSPKVSSNLNNMQNSMIFTILTRIQITNNKTTELKRDKHATIKLFLNKTLEIKLKKDISTFSLEKYRLEITDECICISIPTHSIKIWLNKPEMLTFIMQIKLATKKAKAKSPIRVLEGSGYKLEEGDLFKANITQWEIVDNILVNMSETKEITEKTAINAVQISVIGQKEGSFLAFFTTKKAMLVEITHAEKLKRRVPAAPVAERLAQMEDLSEQLVNRAEQYVRYRRMSAAITKLKKRSMELDAAIDANTFEIASLTSHENDKAFDARSEKALADLKEATEMDSLTSALDGVEMYSDEIRLSAAGGRFGECVASAFCVFCAALADGSDFSPAALIQRLEVAQQEVTAALI